MSTARPVRAAHLGPDVRRPLLLDVALPLFARQGYDAVSMQSIADAAGVSKPVLYSCFASKEELFDALARREDRRLRELVAELTPPVDAGGESDAELLTCALTGIFRAVAEAPDAIRVLYVEDHGEGRVARGRVHWQHWVGAVIAERRATAATRESELIGRLLVAAAELGFTLLLEDEPQWEPAALAAFLGPVLVHGVGAGASVGAPPR